MIELTIAFALGALVMWLWISWRERKSRKNYIQLATKGCLDRIGELYDIPREPGERDVAYRKRMVDAIKSTANMRKH